MSELRDDINNRFDMNDTKFNEQNKKLDVLNVKFEQYKEQNMKFENSINVKLDELTNSLCSIDVRINEICSEIKRETGELRESVCVVDNKYENTVSKSGTANSSSDLEDENVVDHNERECEDSLNEESVQRVESVSYTHLDVYKRQGEDIRKKKYRDKHTRIHNGNTTVKAAEERIIIII